MCNRCADAGEMAKDVLGTEDAAMAWLWNETPFPFAPPSQKQLVELIDHGWPGVEVEWVDPLEQMRELAT